MQVYVCLECGAMFEVEDRTELSPRSGMCDHEWQELEETPPARDLAAEIEDKEPEF